MAAEAKSVPLYQPLARAERLSDRVAEQIERRITEGGMPPGHRLPPERELGEAFGVSRTVVREAIRVLVAKGLVEVQPGNGTVVREFSASMVSDALALLMRARPGGIRLRDAHEIRLMIEPQIAALAAERRTDQDLQNLEAELERMRPEPAEWQAADVRFHAALAQATHNPLCGIVLDSIQDILREVRMLGGQLPGTRESAIRHHTAIVDAVKAADPNAAREAMLAHLRTAKERMERAAQATGGEWGAIPETTK
ncbi:MAG: FadR/GntR family transcriptional regulator [Thermomicrobiales bacterium]